MINNSFTTNNNPTSSKITPLNFDDLASIFGGSDDVIDPNILLGNSSVIVEDLTEL